MQDSTSKLPPCMAACPAGVEVPRYIRHVREGNFDKALTVIREKIPFPAVCGWACQHPCEVKCARQQYDEAVAIRLLKRAAYQYGLEKLLTDKNAPFSGKKIAVIGSGPCGLTAANYLAGMGHEVAVFERFSKPGGMLRYGIPEYRLPKDIVDREISLIIKRGVQIITDTRIAEPEKLLENGFNAVMVAVGAWKPLTLNIGGQETNRILDGLAFLKDVNSGMDSNIGRKVVVIGGGNTALDAARAAVRKGAEVIILYRRTQREMPANPVEVGEALEEGVKIEFLTAPVKVTKNGLTCLKTSLGPLGSSGRPEPIPVEGSEFDIRCDTVVVAVGQAIDAEALGLAVNQKGTIRVNFDTFATNKNGIFAAGDAVSGPSSIIQAIAQGRKVSVSIDKFLGGSGRLRQATICHKETGTVETAPRGTKRPAAKYLPVEERLKEFCPVELGYSKETAIAESNRCLSCDQRQYRVEVDFKMCKGCSYCMEVCSLGIFELSEAFNSQGYRPVGTEHTEKCVGCFKCIYACPDFAINIEEVC